MPTSVSTGTSWPAFGLCETTLPTATLSLGASYSRTTSVVDTEGTSFNAALNWQIGKLDLSAGASTYGSASASPGLQDSERNHYYYYVKLRRELF